MKREEAQFGRKFETQGEWWLPGNEDTPITGTLTYEPENGLILRTFGDFTAKTKGLPSFDTRYYDVILGRCENGTPITLDRCHQAGMSISIGGYSRITLRAISGFFGAHITNPQQQNFRSISLSVTHLESWLGFLPFNETWPNFGSNTGQGLTLTFNPPEHFDIFVSSITARIESSHSMNTKSDEGHFDRKWTYRAQLLVTPTEEKDFRWFVDHASDLKNFIVLLVGQRSYFRYLKLFLTEDPQQPIYSVFSQFEEPTMKGTIHSSEMLGSYQSIKPNLQNILNSWFSDNQEFGPVHDLLFSVIYKPDLYVQSQLLHLLQAIETFHRRTRGGRYVETEEFEAIYLALRSAIPENIKPEFKEVLKGKMKYLNELSLRSRLKSLVNDIPEKLVIRFLGNQKYFINELCEIRDYLTHYSKDNLQPTTKEMSLKYHDFVMKLTVVLSYFLLRQVGIPDEQLCKNLIQKYHHLRKPE